MQDNRRAIVFIVNTGFVISQSLLCVGDVIVWNGLRANIFFVRLAGTFMADTPASATPDF